MHIEFLSLTKALNVPLLSQDDIAAVHRLQKQWEHWANRERSTPRRESPKSSVPRSPRSSKTRTPRLSRSRS